MKKKLECILLIDDNKFTNIYNKSIISKLDAANQVYEATNGQEGIDYLKREGKFASGKFPVPDLILLDINMPRMDGWEFMDEYHKLNENSKARVVIVMLTSSPNPDDMEKAKIFPEITAFMKKPLTPEMFKEILDKHFS